MLIARPRRAHSAMTNRGFARDNLRSGYGCRSATAGPASRVAERSPHDLAVFFLRPCDAKCSGEEGAERKNACAADLPERGDAQADSWGTRVALGALWLLLIPRCLS